MMALMVPVIGALSRLKNGMVTNGRRGGTILFSKTDPASASGSRSHLSSLNYHRTFPLPSFFWITYSLSFHIRPQLSSAPGPSVSHSAQTTKAPRLSLPTSGFLGLGDFM